MQSALDKDQVSSDVLGLSHGGVLEVTRQRIGPSLLQALTEQNSQYPWFTRRWRPEITAHRAICKARREINSGSSAITICANQCVLDLFSDYNSIAHWLRASFYIQEDNKMSDDEVISELTKIRGIGKWTAEMYLIFGLGRLDVFPLGDLGLINGIKKLYGLENPTNTEILKITNKWIPYRTIGTWYIWKGVKNFQFV